MKAEVWSLTVHESVLAQAHGWGISLIELYIPEENIHFNFHNGSLNCWSGLHREDRYGQSEQITIPDQNTPKKVGSIDLSDELVKLLRDYVDIRAEVENHEGWFNDEVLNKFKSNEIHYPCPAYALESNEGDDNG